MADYAPRLDQRDSLTRRERNIIDRTLGLNEQLLLVTRPDPSILKVELCIHFGIATLILITSEAEPSSVYPPALSPPLVQEMLQTPHPLSCQRPPLHHPDTQTAAGHEM